MMLELESTPMIIPIWQKQGSSTHLIAQKVGMHLGEPATHTGTLDPMAQGLVVVLTGTDRFLKGPATAWEKTYTFSIVWGLRTDTGDTLGLIDSYVPQVPDLSRVIHALHTYTTTYHQSIPDFSARRYNGSSSFSLARKGYYPPQKKRRVTIHTLTLDSHELIALSTLATQEADVIQTIVGDFRQSEIVSQWQNYRHHTAELLVSHHTATVSTGTYIRQLTQDIAAELQLPALTKNIVRVSNGKYTRESCEESTHFSIS